MLRKKKKKKGGVAFYNRIPTKDFEVKLENGRFTFVRSCSLRNLKFVCLFVFLTTLRAINIECFILCRYFRQTVFGQLERR